MRRSRTWEEKCRLCGRCCYEKVEYAGEIFYTDVPCEFLDLRTRRCTVYARRHRERPGCAPLTPDHLHQGILPADCPYVADIPGYRAPRLWSEEDENS